MDAEIHVVVNPRVVPADGAADALPREAPHRERRTEHGLVRDGGAHQREVRVEVAAAAVRVALAVVLAQHPRAGDGDGLRVRGEQLDDRLDPALVRFAVGVEAGDESARRGIEAGRARNRDAVLALRDHARARLPRDDRGAVAAVVVDHDHLTRPDRLTGDGRETVGEHPGVVTGGDHDGDVGDRAGRPAARNLGRPGVEGRRKGRVWLHVAIADRTVGASVNPSTGTAQPS